MDWLGVGLLLLVPVGLILTGLPAIVVILSAAALGAAALGFGGDEGFSLLTALPNRVVALLENDLLQALPLYVLMGALLNRLPVADALFGAGAALLPRGPAAALVSGMGLGALLGPMNGSVGASVLALSRAMAPRLAANGVAPAQRHAAVAVASTLGIVIPPSLVLILLGDAMFQAHTIASRMAGRSARIINTQDVFHAALAPAGLFLLFCLILAWWTGRGQGVSSAPPARSTRVQALTAGVTVLFVVVLLAGVATGYFYAVEAAAMGAVSLLTVGILGRHLNLAGLSDVLRDALAGTGALFALLLAATTLTLVLRVLGTDRLVGDWLAAIPGGAMSATAVVLAIIGLSAFALDAFEIIFVVVPIVIPPLLVRVADAQWVAVLVLLALQASFVLPPVGYALMMARSALGDAPPMRLVARALAPFLAAQLCVLALVLLEPGLVHLAGARANSGAALQAPVSDEEAAKSLRDMTPAPPEPEIEDEPAPPK